MSRLVSRLPGFSGTNIEIGDKLTISNSTDNEGELIIFGGAGNTIVADINNAGTNSAIKITQTGIIASGKAALWVYSIADQDNAPLVFFEQDNGSSSGNCLNLQNDGTGGGVNIDQNGNGSAIVITSESTSRPVVDIQNPKNTSASVLVCDDANSLTTESILKLASNSSSTSTRSLVKVTNDNTLATGAKVLELIQDSAQECVLIDQNGNERALRIDSEATNNPVIDIDNPQTTSGNIIICDDADSLTSGGILLLTSNSSDTSQRTLVTITNDNTLATGTKVLELIQDSDTACVLIDQNGDGKALRIDSEAINSALIDCDNPQSTSGNIIICDDADSLTTGSILKLASNSSDSSARDLVSIVNDHISAIATRCLSLKQDAAKEAMDINMGTLDKGFINFRATADGDATSAISTFTTSGATTHHLQVLINGTAAWIAVSTNDPTA